MNRKGILQKITNECEKLKKVIKKNVGQVIPIF